MRRGMLRVQEDEMRETEMWREEEGTEDRGRPRDSELWRSTVSLRYLGGLLDGTTCKLHLSRLILKSDFYILANNNFIRRKW